MSEIHKIEKNGVTIYPATTTDAVVDPIKRIPLSSIPLNDFIVDAKITNWAGDPDDILGIDYIYRNDSSYGSGIRIKKYKDSNLSEGTEVVYYGGLSGNRSGIDNIGERNLSEGLGTIELIVDWNQIPNGWNKVLKCPIFLKGSFFIKTFVREYEINNLKSEVDANKNGLNELKIMGLPMMEKSSEFKDLTFKGITLTAFQLSDFLLDVKFEGSPENGYTYAISQINNNSNPGKEYNYYVAICKVDSSGQETIIASKYIGKTATGEQMYDVTVNSEAVSVNKITVYVDWDKISGADGVVYINYKNGYKLDNSYIFNPNIGLIYERAKESEQLNQIREIALLAEEKAGQANAKLATSESTVWELPNDLDFFAGAYSYTAIGQYTKVMTETVSFNQVRLNKVSYSGYGNVQYKLYVVKGIADTSKRDCPVGPIHPDTHTLIKEGYLGITSIRKDHLIELDTVYSCPIGSQVVIYLVALNQISIRGVSNGIGNPEKTSNVSLLCTEDNPFNGGKWVAGSLNKEANTGYFNVALSLLIVPLFASKENVQQIVKDEVKELIPGFIMPDLKITIPDKVYAVVGTELNLWNDAVSLSVDKGLFSPANYQVRWYCTKGLITDRCFRFTPTDSDIGFVNCTCYLYDMQGELIDSKQFQIITLGKNQLDTAKNIVYFGDSLGQSAAYSLYANFNNPEKFTGIVPTMRGTRGTTYKYEAVGGYRWVDYATSGRYAYRIQVENIASASVGAMYSLDGYPNYFEIREVNIVNGSGNMLIEYQYGSQASNFPASGKLTKTSGSGDEIIHFTGAYQEPNNPLWNNSTDKLDIAQYKTKIGLSGSEKIDAVSFQFGINDNGLADNLDTLQGYIEDLYDAFTADNPDCKFIIGMTTSSGNDVNGAGANYEASYDWMSFLQNTYKIRQFYLTLQDSPRYPNLRIAPVSLEVDRYYGYAFSERPISQRYAETEKYHNNYVHPGNSGYGQMADAYFAAYIATLTE